MITQTYTISTIKQSTPPIVKMSQYDHGSRTITFSVVDGSGQAVVLTGKTVRVEGTRLDGHAFAEDCTVSGNTASFTDTSDMTNAPGAHPAELVIESDGDRLGTMNFVISVETAAMDENADITEEDVSLFEQLLGSIEDATGAVEAEKTAALSAIDDDKDAALLAIAQGLASGSPLVVDAVADMTDQTAVYLYSGSESGYTAGNFYFWNGSAWVSGGTYGNPTVDAAFSDSSVNPVQNKVVSAAVSSLKSDLKALPDQIVTGLYNGSTVSLLNWDNGWINSSGVYNPNSPRFMTQVFQPKQGQTVVNNSESTVYITYFSSFTDLSNFEYDSYVAIASEGSAAINTSKSFFMIESLSETKDGLYGVGLYEESIAEYLSYENIKRKKPNADAYVSNNAITWYKTSGGVCYLTIGADIVIRTNYGTSRDNIIAQISTSSLFAAVQSAGITVTDGVISGASFAIVFDFDDNTLKVLTPMNKAIFDNTLILFVNHYLSWTGGTLIENANSVDVKTSLQSLNSSVTNINNELAKISPTLPAFLAPETETCFNELVETCDEKTMVIAFTTDNHYGASNGMNFPVTATSIKSVNDKFPIDFVVDGGDLINGDKTKDEDIADLSAAVQMLLKTGKAAYTLIGNHDDGSFTSTELPLLTKGEMYALLERHSGINLDYIDVTEHYGYKDFDEYNLRIIFLDSMYGTNGHLSSSWGYSDAELAWFTNNALNTNKQIVMFSHMAFTASFIAYGVSIKNGAEMRAAVENFIANGGTVVALFHGHNHWDYIGQYSQTNGFKEVSTGCGRIVSGPTIPYTHPEGAVMPERVEGTVTQELWDIITIKPESREVKMIRYGAGNDRTFTY